MLMHQLIYSVSEEKNLFGNLNRHILVRQSFYGENECCLRLSLRVYTKTFIFIIVSGMTKEVSNLIKENNELLETK
jgi:hypothetical protein